MHVNGGGRPRPLRRAAAPALGDGPRGRSGAHAAEGPVFRPQEGCDPGGRAHGGAATRSPPGLSVNRGKLGPARGAGGAAAASPEICEHPVRPAGHVAGGIAAPLPRGSGTERLRGAGLPGSE